MEHLFTAKIKEILQNNFEKNADDIFEKANSFSTSTKKLVQQKEVQKQEVVLQIFMLFM